MTTHEPSEREIDAIVSMRSLSDAGYAPVQRALGAAKSVLIVEPTHDHVTAFAAKLAVIASEAPSQVPGNSSRAAARSPWTRRAAAAMAVAAVAVLGVAGAAAANDAAPGDLLYGFDQALERVGINDGGTSERLREAQALVERGEVDRGVDFAVKALDDEGEHEAARALESAGQSALPGTGNETVAAFLQWISEQDRGPGFGADVAVQAKTLGGAEQADKGDKPAAPGILTRKSVEPGAQGSKPTDPSEQGSKPADPEAQGNAPVDPGEQGANPVDPGEQGNAPADPGAQGNAPADPGEQGAKPADPGSQGKKPSDKP